MTMRREQTLQYYAFHRAFSWETKQFVNPAATAYPHASYNKGD